MLRPFRPAEVLYHINHHEANEETLGVKYEALPELLQKADVVFLCVPDEAGKDFFSYDQFSQMKQGSLLVSFMHPGIVNEDALYDALKSGKIRAASDYPMGERFNEFPLSTWYSFNGSNAFNTRQELQYVSDEAVKSLINLLKNGEDKRLVNPEYGKGRL